MPKFPLRFSLATLLLLVTIVCLSAALWSSSKELRRARADLEVVQAKIDEYRNELGYPTIEDPSKLHFIRVPLPGPQQWQWRVYVPQGRRLWIHFVTKCLSYKEIEESGGICIPLPDGETMVYCAIRNQKGAPTLYLEVVGHGAVRHSLEGIDADWPDNGGWKTEIRGSNGTQCVEKGRKALLLRLQDFESTGEVDPSNSISSPWPNPNAAGEGLTVWIAESKDNVENSEKVETE